ncbi:MAG: maleylpyruvate isomerase family mycothiol-dependent enzyme [Ilumatobacter sp.]
MTVPFDQLEVFQTTSSTFIELARGSDPSTPIPSCPDWTVAAITDHMADCWTFWSRVVADGLTQRHQLPSIDIPEGLEGERLVDWLATSRDALNAALTDAPSDQAAWSWAGSNLDAAWVLRRMVHESTVHLWDIAVAVGHPYEIPTSVAADGIDEFLTHFMGHRRNEGAMKVGGTVHLHCTDTSENDVAGGEWFVSAVKEPSCTFTREHRKGDAAIRGAAHDLQMWLWRRNGDRPGNVEVIGDDVVARRFRAYSDLGF